MFLLFLVFSVINVSLVICGNNETKKEIVITLKAKGENCSLQSNYNFYVGDEVYINIDNIERELRYTVRFKNESAKDYSTIGQQSRVLFPSIVKENEGVWSFEFAYQPSTSNIFSASTTIIQGIRFWHSVCSTNVKIDAKPAQDSETGRGHPDKSSVWVWVAAAVGTLVAIIMIGQTVGIIYFRTEVQRLGRHNNLLKKSDDCDGPDSDRYSTNPSAKVKKLVPPIDQRRDSEIYEVPDITMGGLPPALPISPRPGHPLPAAPLRIPPSPSMTLRSNASSHPTFPRPKPSVSDQDTLPKKPLFQRPPIPVPQDKFYPDPQEENTYEPPPIKDLPPRTVPPVMLGKQLPDIPMQGLKPRGNPPIVKPNKPPIAQTKPTPPRNNETKPTLPRNHDARPSLPRTFESKPTLPRNNVIQVPIRPIPSPSSLKRPVAKPKPPATKPKTPPLPPLEQQVKLFNYHLNERHTDDSDDEEWTYEPLPQYNIYNI